MNKTNGKHFIEGIVKTVSFLQFIRGFSLWSTLFAVSFFSFTLSVQANVVLQDIGHEAEKLPDAYQRVLAHPQSNLTSLSPDQRWLLVANLNYVAYQVPIPEKGLFNAAGKKLYRSFPLHEKSVIYSHINMIERASGTVLPIALPEGHVVDFEWSPNAQHLALAVLHNERISLWRYDVESQQMQLWSRAPLALKFSNHAMFWLPDSEHLVVTLNATMPQGVGFNQAKGVVIKNSESRPKSRVYRHLIDNSVTAQRFKNIGAQQLVLINPNGEQVELSQPGLIESFSVSPSGEYLLYQEIDSNFHHSMKFSRLARCSHVIHIPTKQKVYSPKCQSAAVLASRLKDSAPSGARQVSWRPDQAHSLMWVEALDAGDPRNEAKYRDQIVSLHAPFTAQTRIIHQSDWRIFQLYSTSQGRFFFSDWQAETKQLRLWSDVFSGQGQSQPVSLFQYNYKDKYQDPGDIVTYRTALGNVVAQSNTKHELFFMGNGWSKTGRQAFVDARSVAADKRRVFISKASTEQIPHRIALNADSEEIVLFLSLKKGEGVSLQASNKVEPLFEWPVPKASKEVTHQHLQFKREDGVTLLSDLYLPAKASRLDENEKLPVIIWLYPREYRNNREQQRRTSDNAYVAIHPLGPLVGLLEGVAVLDASGIPIVEEAGQEANDTFVEQQIMNAKAILSALEKTGKIDVKRSLIMGHSYGAFSVVSLLANTDLFQAGIARSGAYNRTLTPLGFQGEKRSMWEAPDLYRRLSPIFQANDIKEPLLIVHGAQDTNPGTAPMQSEMLFEAVQANGGTARLVLLPDEGHQYATRSGMEVLLLEQRAWIQQWLSSTNYSD